MSRYSVLIVGMGKRGRHHASAFRNDPAFEVAGICDIDRKRLDEARASLGDGVEAGTDAAAMAKALRPDVFCFCTMPHLRLGFVRIGVESGSKLIALEKPIADSSAVAMEMKKILQSSGVKAVVSHQHRYGEHYRKVREIVESGALGRIHTIYAGATGWMMHMMTHMLDYMRWYNGDAEAKWVMGQASGTGKLGDNHPSPDYIGGFIQFENGVRGIVETGAGAPDVPEVAKWWGRNRIRVMGDRGFAEVLTNGGWRSVTDAGVQTGPGAMNYDLDMPPYVRDMAEWLDGGRIHPCNFASACKGFEIMMGLCRSAARGGQVPLPLAEGADELAELRAAMRGGPAILGSPSHAAEYPGCK